MDVSGNDIMMFMLNDGDPPSYLSSFYSYDGSLVSQEQTFEETVISFLEMQSIQNRINYISFSVIQVLLIFMIFKPYLKEIFAKFSLKNRKGK